MSNKRLKIFNARIVTPSTIIKGGTIVVADGKIEEISDCNLSVPNADSIDAKNRYAAPGCIDIHVHGGGGRYFNEGTPDAFYSIAQTHAMYGTTTLFPTIMSAPISVFEDAIATCEEILSNPVSPDGKIGANMIGLHFEGNYLNMLRRGGQNPNYLSFPKPEEYESLCSNTSCIRRWSSAPELPGALELGKYLSRRGILPAIAHTVADYPQVKAAFEAGYTHATHFYNAMTSVHKEGEYKHEGTVEAVYLMKNMTVEVIADGIHVPPAILHLIWQIKGTERTALVTDAMANAGYKGDKPVGKGIIVEDGVCKLADHSALAGSIATTDRLLRTMVKQADIPLIDAVRMASETPARIMHINNRKGSIVKGMDADIILFDDDIQISTTIIGGHVAWKA